MKLFAKSICMLVALGGSILTCAYTVADNSVSPEDSPLKTATIADTIRFSFPDSSFKVLDSTFVEISADDYLKFEKADRSKCKIDSTGFVDGYGISSKRHCHEICVDYLEEKQTGNKLILPCDYDGGLHGLLISQRCKQFIVYSSYDGPDYTKYYDHRAEIFGFTFSDSTGLAAIEPSFKFRSKDWSIEAVIWINEKQIALKTYTASRSGDENNLQFRYYKMTLKTH